MSYILEALKKAEAERNGDAHRPAVLLPPLVAGSKNPPAWRRPLPWAALAALAVTMASAAWFSLSRDKPVHPVNPPVSEQPKPAPVVAPEMPALSETKVAKTERQKEKPAPKKAAEKKRVPPREETKTAAAPPEPSVGTLQDLPAQIQRDIPALTVGGYIYSGTKADRSVLVNNRLLREGDEAAPGLVLEKMTPSGMVLNYKGYRYRRGY